MIISEKDKRLKSTCFVIGAILLSLSFACVVNVEIRRIPEFHFFEPTTYRIEYRWHWGQWAIPLFVPGILLVVLGLHLQQKRSPKEKNEVPRPHAY